MEVHILGSESELKPEFGVLKIYDRRFAAQLRADNKIEPWTPAHEMVLGTFVQSGEAQKFLDSLRNNDDFEEPEDGWNVAENETYLLDQCLNLYNMETSVYKKLQDQQGKSIPQLRGQYSLILDTHTHTTESETSDDLSSVKGILLEHIPGFTLSDLATDAPQEAWQSILDRTIQIVHILSDSGILNQDVRTSNVLVTRGANEYRVVMIDFALCRFRDEYGSEDEWGRAKWSQDEEGAIGMVVQSRMAKLGHRLEYQRSMKFLKWAERE